MRHLAAILILALSMNARAQYSPPPVKFNQAAADQIYTFLLMYFASHDQGVTADAAQPQDADLTSLAAASGTSTLYYRSAANTWSPITLGGNLTFSGGALNSLAPGTGTVTSASVVTANGVSASVATSTTTPAFTFTIGDISPTSLAGVATNSNAAAGKIGEFVSSYVATGSPISLTNNTSSNVTSISLTAGDWDVEGNVNFTGAGLTITGKTCGISSASATLPTDGSEVFSGLQSVLITATDGLAVPRKRVSISGTTTVYLVAKGSFTVGTLSSFGGLTARRAR